MTPKLTTTKLMTCFAKRYPNLVTKLRWKSIVTSLNGTLNMTTESVPHISMDPAVRFPSTWRQPIGKLLTTRIINQRALEGYYGPIAKLRAEKSKAIIDGRVVKCQGLCGGENIANMGFKKWSYLPKAGWYCSACTKAYRAMVEHEKSLSQSLASRIKQEYV